MLHAISLNDDESYAVMKKLFLILLLSGCNEPIKHESKTYTGDSDWLRINKLVTEIEQQEVDLCINDKSTCQPASDGAAGMVRSLEK